MSEEAYNRFAPELKPGGLLIAEEDLVRVSDLPGDLQILRGSGDAVCRRIRKAHGSELGDGRILRSRHQIAQRGVRAQSRGGFGAGDLL
jgi:hypothetical protein